MPKKPPASVLVGVRMRPELLERIDALTNDADRLDPGEELVGTRSDVIRRGLHIALPIMEEGAGMKKP